jgi:CRP-like cAMP-binding protein
MEMTQFSSLARSEAAFPKSINLTSNNVRRLRPHQNQLTPQSFEQVFVPHGETLLRQGEPSPAILYILSGWALEEQLTREGEIAWAHITMRGEVAGLNSVAFEGHCDGEALPVSTAFIHALTDVFALRVPRSLILAAADEDRALGHMIQDVLRRQSASLHNHLVALSAKCASDRVVQILRSLHARALEQGSITRSDCRLPISQVVLAKFANLSVVHLNRIAQKLRQDGVLDWNSDGVCLLRHEAFE